ncbi:glycosyltransferase family 61 protein [Cellulomonas rhizosphaerae]|uniref:Glycosyltransferase family 61 protein n=1 Tax=Cellulomonas rhizosphaerae TaxID=2293719 RepID=A0A413RJR4_9CELL|nr:glycosyltransferase family 61 protein [Cellulomonas rhizosphaerae]
MATHPAGDPIPQNVTLHLAATPSERVRVVAELPRFDAALDMLVDQADKVAALRSLAYFVKVDGTYLVREPGERHAGSNVTALLDGLTALAASVEMRRSAPVPDAELAQAVVVASSSSAVASLTRRRHFYFKLRDAEADRVLTQRYGAEWGDVLHTVLPREFAAQGSVTAHGTGPALGSNQTIDVPALHLRSYRWPRASVRQLLTYGGDYVLPDAFRHPLQPTLSHPQLAGVSRDFGRLLRRAQPTSRRKLRGAYYYIDCTYPTHFGHITTEVLARLWGWELARREHPGIRPLLTVRTEGAGMPSYQGQILAALGMDPATAEVVGPHEAVDVETLLSVTPAFENPFYVAPEMAELWTRLSAGLPDAAPPTDNERIFISRRTSGKRDCIETPEVERYFAAAGFSVIYPEEHGYAEQRAMFSRARIVAGFGGSGMFNMMFAPSARIIIISGDAYTAANEFLFAAANGNELHYFWGTSTIRPPKPGAYLHEAFQSDFHFDVHAFAPELAPLLA